MKQFEFRLQKVMETTRTREELQKRELAKALGVLHSNEQLLDEMFGRLEEQIGEYTSRRNGGSMKASEMLAYSRYSEKLAADIRRQQLAIEKLAQLVIEHRDKLIDISKDKKVLERLKEKKYEEFRKKLRSMEQKFMDEVSVRNYQNGRSEGQ